MSCRFDSNKKTTLKVLLLSKSYILSPLVWTLGSATVQIELKVVSATTVCGVPGTIPLVTPAIVTPRAPLRRFVIR